MAESIENQQQNETDSSKVHRSRSGFWIGMIVFAVIVTLGGAGFYLLKELRDEQKGLGGEIDKGDKQLLELSHQITGYQEQLTAVQKQLATLEAQIAGKDQHFNETLASFSKLHQEKSDALRRELSGEMAQIQRQLGKTRGDWLIADAEYLLSIAGQRLHLTGDIATTREALVAADERLRESGDAGVFKVREELAKEIASLDKMQAIDIVGVYSSLQVLAEQVDNLTLASPYVGKEINKPQVDAAKAEEAHGLLDSALGELEGLVSIRHSDQPVNSILTPEQAYFIKEQLKVKLEMVKIALVQQNQTLYKTNLDDTRQWLKDNFAMDKNATGFTEQLNKLAALQIRPQLPEISTSLKMLRTITKLRLEADKASPSAPAQQPQQPASPAPQPSEAQPKPDAPAEQQ